MWAISLALSLGGCGGGRPAEKRVIASPNTEQSLADGVKALCDAPVRAEADPDWAKAGEPGRRASIVGKHLVEGVTNPRALQVANAEPDRRAVELDAIVKESGVAPCALQAAWSAAPVSDDQAVGSGATP